MLKHGPKPKGLRKVGRSKVSYGEVVQALEQIWEICGRICSKRHKSFLPEMVEVLDRHRERVELDVADNGSGFDPGTLGDSPSSHHS